MPSQQSISPVKKKHHTQTSQTSPTDLMMTSPTDTLDDLIQAVQAAKVYVHSTSTSSITSKTDSQHILADTHVSSVYAAASSSSSSTTIPQLSPPIYIRNTAKLYSLFLVEQENNGALEEFARIVDGVKPVSNPNWKKVYKVWNERVESKLSNIIIADGDVALRFWDYVQ
eukprot:g55588.t1